MRVVLASDKWAGTLDAGAAVAAAADGWARTTPGDDLVAVPLSDGGPGFVAVLHRALGGTLLPAVVADPLGRPVPAEVLLAGGTAYVEAAAAAGLDLVAPAEREPERASSYGVGELLRVAAAAGPDRIVVGLGGTATTDGGAGLLRALGAGADCLDLEVVDLGGAELVAATDVDNPLLGLTGAAAVFGPQKGADPSAVQRLDMALTTWADRLERAAGRPLRILPGAGAAGGIGAALFALGARREPGAGMVAAATGLAGRIDGSDLVVTGEGRYDATSLRGKVTAAVAGAAQDAGVPCLVLAGSVAVGRREAAAHGVSGTYATADLAGSVDAAIARPAYWLAELAAQVAAEWSH